MSLGTKSLDVLLWVIVYVPLIISTLWIIFAFIYYKNYVKVFAFIKRLLGYTFTFIQNIGRIIYNNIFLSLAVTVFASTLIGLYFVIKTGLPHWAGSVGQWFLPVLLAILAIGSVIGIFVIFNRDNTNLFPPFPQGNRWGDVLLQMSWLGGRINKYLLFSIVAGLGIALVLGLIYGFTSMQHTAMGILFNIGMVMLGLAVLFGAYSIISKNSSVRHWIDNNIVFNALYHLIFIIPCSFWFLTKFLYKEFATTPQFAYILLGLQIIFLTGFFLIPVITKELYTFSYGKNITKKNLEDSINTLIQSRDNYMASNSRLKSEIYVNWDKIIKQNLNNKPDELKKHLLMLGYNNDIKKTLDNLTLDKITKYIHATLPKILNNQSYITDTDYKIKQKQNELKNLKSRETGKTLLNNPVPTNVEKTIGTYQNLVDKNATEFNYNYAIGCWVFIHNYGTNLSPAYVVDTPLLNYGYRPAILWNGKSRELKIKIRDGDNNIRTVFKTDKIPLQKWVNIVVNYNGGTLDVFIDKTLVASVDNIIPSMSYDKIIIGKDKGISGGICNVTYYKNVLTKNQIELYYNLLKNKNPPIV